MSMNSMLDQDLYKFSQGQAVFLRYPDAQVKYKFIDRRHSKYNTSFLNEFKRGLSLLAERRLADHEAEWLLNACPWIKHSYIDYLSSYRFNLRQLAYGVDESGNFRLSIFGPWVETIFWEVPLMALISECYFRIMEPGGNVKSLESDLQAKRDVLESRKDLRFADFGTRRRRDYATQQKVVEYFASSKNFIGTSNCHFAQMMGVKPIGTCAHEWFMGISALENLRFANREALRIWNEIYEGHNGIALTDTYGTKSFFRDFDVELAEAYDGVRQDSGDPFVFADAAIKHYKSLKIDPLQKTIVFSDGLTVKNAVKIHDHCAGRIGCSFGIGTHFTNDFADRDALNIVIKLDSVDGFNVAKLSDNWNKACGNPAAIACAKFIHS